MPTARKRLVCPEITPYYHCVNRCVRRAFLCGIDPNTGKDLSHRKAFIEKLMFTLARAFAFDICAYAVMSNHYHIVLHMDRARAKGWTLVEVIQSWHQVFRGTNLSQRFLKDEVLSTEELDELEQQAEIWRSRLVDLSWYMRVLNERVARQANLEDGCTGRFWGKRYSSQALLDEPALLGCMTYVDLNPVRAGLAKTPEASDYTSIQKRVRYAVRSTEQPPELMLFTGIAKPEGLPFSQAAYFELVDWTSRYILDGKASVSKAAPPLLERVGIDISQWSIMTQHFESNFKGLIGTLDKLKSACKRFNFRYCTGISACKAAFGSCAEAT